MISQTSSADIQKIIRRTRSGKIAVSCKYKNKFIPRFLIGIVILCLLSLVYLDINWIKLALRLPDIGGIFWELAHFNFANFDLILPAILETVSIAVLSLLYSLLLGIFFGSFGAHKFYLGKTFWGVLYLLFCWTGVPFIVGLVEGVRYIFMSQDDFFDKYIEK